METGNKKLDCPGGGSSKWLPEVSLKTVQQVSKRPSANGVTETSSATRLQQHEFSEASSGWIWIRKA
jgi:hypothetical protein